MTADRATLIALAERVEQAQGPDRLLDAEIACAVRFTDLRPAHPNDFDGRYFYTPGNIKFPTGFLQSAAYTASLDAAVTLVPEGWDWSVSRCAGDGSFPPYSANLSPEAQPYLVSAEIDTEAATPALALTAAALRAHAAMGDGK